MGKLSEIKIFNSLEDPMLKSIIGNERHKNLKEELDLIQGVYQVFDQKKFLEGKLQPVFFGSALNNFGVEELLNCFIEIAPDPLPKSTIERMIQPG